MKNLIILFLFLLTVTLLPAQNTPALEEVQQKGKAFAAGYDCTEDPYYTSIFDRSLLTYNTSNGKIEHVPFTPPNCTGSPCNDAGDYLNCKANRRFSKPQYVWPNKLNVPLNNFTTSTVTLQKSGPDLHHSIIKNRKLSTHFKCEQGGLSDTIFLGRCLLLTTGICQKIESLDKKPQDKKLYADFISELKKTHTVANIKKLNNTAVPQVCTAKKEDGEISKELECVFSLGNESDQQLEKRLTLFYPLYQLVEAFEVNNSSKIDSFDGLNADQKKLFLKYRDQCQRLEKAFNPNLVER